MQSAGGNGRSPKKLNVMSTSEVEIMDNLDNSGGKERWGGVPVS